MRVNLLEKIYRASIHVPVGAVTPYLVEIHPVVAFIYAQGFFVYELNEDWHLKDKAYLDIFGYLVGLFLCSAAYIWLRWTTLILAA